MCESLLKSQCPGCALASSPALLHKPTADAGTLATDEHWRAAACGSCNVCTLLASRRHWLPPFSSLPLPQHFMFSSAPPAPHLPRALPPAYYPREAVHCHHQNNVVPASNQCKQLWALVPLGVREQPAAKVHVLAPLCCPRPTSDARAPGASAARRSSWHWLRELRGGRGGNLRQPAAGGASQAVGQPKLIHSHWRGGEGQRL